MRRFLSVVFLCGLLSTAPVHAAITTTSELVTVVPGLPGSWSYSVGGWTGGGLVTGIFEGVDGDSNGQLSFFDGEVTDFSASYSGGTIVAPVAFGFGDLFGLVYDLDGGPLGDGVVLDIEGIGANGVGTSFAIGPGPVGVCGGVAVCGRIEGPAAAQIAEPPTLSLLGLLGLGLLAGMARRRVG